MNTRSMRMSWPAALAVGLCLAVPAAQAATMTVERLNALRAASPLLTWQANVAAGDWETILAAIPAVEPTAAPRDASHELAAEQLALALRQAPITAMGRQWLAQVAQWPVLTRVALPDAGRGIPVPAFPAGAAARATLRVWQAREAAARIQQGLDQGAVLPDFELTPQLLAQLTTEQLRALRDRLPRPLPADWALALLRVVPDVDRLSDWLAAEMRADERASASRRVAGCRFVLSTGQAALFDQLAEAALAHDGLRAAWLQALAADTGARSRAALQNKVSDTRYGLDALRALARRPDGRRWLLEQLEEPGLPRVQLRRVLIALAEQDESAVLRDWVQSRRQQHAELAEEVLAWLGD